MSIWYWGNFVTPSARKTEFIWHLLLCNNFTISFMDFSNTHSLSQGSYGSGAIAEVCTCSALESPRAAIKVSARAGLRSHLSLDRARVQIQGFTIADSIQIVLGFKFFADYVGWAPSTPCCMGFPYGSSDMATSFFLLRKGESRPEQTLQPHVT